MPGFVSSFGHDVHGPLFPFVAWATSCLRLVYRYDGLALFEQRKSFFRGAVRWCLDSLVDVCIETPSTVSHESYEHVPWFHAAHSGAVTVNGVCTIHALDDLIMIRALNQS